MSLFRSLSRKALGKPDGLCYGKEKYRKLVAAYEGNALFDRLDAGAEPQMRELAMDIFEQLKDKLTLDDGYDKENEPFKSILGESTDSCS